MQHQWATISLDQRVENTVLRIPEIENTNDLIHSPPNAIPIEIPGGEVENVFAV